MILLLPLCTGFEFTTLVVIGTDFSQAVVGKATLRVLIMVFNATFSYIVAVSFIGGENRNTRRQPPTCHKSPTSFIT